MKIDASNSVLMIFNMQLELIPLLDNSYQLLHNCRWLVDLFHTHSLPIIFTEHKKLGDLSRDLTDIIPQPNIVTKHHFSLMREVGFADYLSSLNKHQILLAGAESHVCMYQTAIDLKQAGYEVIILCDSVSSRSNTDRQVALDRFKYHQFELITQEMLFFELIEHSETPHYLDLALKFLDGRYIR